MNKLYSGHPTMNLSKPTFADECKADATARYGRMKPGSTATAELLSNHVQQWPDSALNSGGIGACVITDSPTAVVKVGTHYFVYHDKYAYEVDGAKINKTQKDLLMKNIKDQNLPGLSDAKSIGGYQS